MKMIEYDYEQLVMKESLWLLNSWSMNLCNLSSGNQQEEGVNKEGFQHRLLSVESLFEMICILITFSSKDRHSIGGNKLKQANLDVYSHLVTGDIHKGYGGL